MHYIYIYNNYVKINNYEIISLIIITQEINVDNTRFKTVH